MRWGLSMLLAGLLTGSALAGSNADPVHTSAEQRDISAVYSALMQRSDVFKSLGRGQNQCWAIADTTINIDDMNPAVAPDTQLKPPGNDPRPFQEALADFNARKYQREALTHSSSSQYVMVTPEEASAFRASRTSATAGAGGKRYSSCGGITYFSEVYFSSHRTAALVYMLNWCGNLCGHGEWVYLEKRDEHWALRSGQEGIVSGARPF
ncbi:hypothetical protein [Alloacidobacterium sp.]|uniref:hypothetical protein n=1 Tax=Alloacidobacterium sp. TaxID=2951999 RepID=UPI002D6025FA|nr:hypothetical protein [Alloacidobacterium sp.]HYK37004.1 hypothetical protein [Alloacidobacterium sp.]